MNNFLVEVGPMQYLEHACGRKKNGPQRYPSANLSGICEYVTFHGKGVFVDVIKLSLFRWGDSGLSQGSI